MSVAPSLSSSSPPPTSLRHQQHEGGGEEEEDDDDDKKTDAQITPATTPTQVESIAVTSSRSESVISLEEHEENRRGEKTQETNMEVILSDFENRALNLVRQSDRRFPFKQSIIWMVEFDEDREYSIHIMSNKRRL